MPSTFRLRLKIILTLTVFLGLAMVLSDVILTLNHQKNLILVEVEKAQVTVSLLADQARLAMGGGAQRGRLLADFRQYDLALRLAENSGEVWYDSIQANDNVGHKIKQLAKLAQASRREQVQFLYGPPTFLGRQYSHFVVARPILHSSGQQQGSLVLVADLAGVRSGIFAGQRLFLAYCFFNLALLVFLAYLRLARIIIKPLQSLATRAEEYRDEGDFLFRSDQRNDDFSSLSTSLNSMLRRINTDREKLQGMVAQLEKANLSLLQAQEEVIRAEKLASVGRLSAGIAHEIGNPIGIVLGYLELLDQDDLAPVERADCLQRAMAEIQRINTILRQLLDLSRPSQDGVDVVAVHGLLDTVCQGLALQPLLGEMEVSLEFEADHDQVLADGEKLHQVFLNLIMNAADACRESSQPRLVIRSCTQEGEGGEGDVLQISWQDNGPGIAPENIAAVFDPFFTTKEPGMGTGLGLSVSYMIIEAAGGKISVTSEGEGQGTTFTVLLPINCSCQLQTDT